MQKKNASVSGGVGVEGRNWNMEELELFLACHHGIRKAAFLVGDCGPERIEEIFQYTDLEQCCIICPWPSGDIGILEERLRNDAARGLFHAPHSLTCVPYYQFEGMEGTWALCPIRCGGEDILPLLKYHPAYLSGSVEEGAVSAFRLWEECRTFCRNVGLKTWRQGKAPLFLDWEKKGGEEKELSVILPVYNVAPYIEKCLKTVTEWKADYVEFIFVSDGSKDQSAAIVKRWMKQDSRIRLIEKENGGCASARQAGLEYASGRYIGFVDPDDFIDGNMYRKLLKAAMCGSFDISLCGYNEYYENSGTVKPAEDSLWYPYLDGCYDSDKIKELITYCRVAIWRGIYRRKFLEENDINFHTDIRRFDDLPFKVETFAQAKSVVMIPEYLYYYRLEREGQDVAADDERLYVHFDIFRHLNRSVGGMRNQKLTDHLQMCKIQTHRYALSKIKEEYREEYLKRTREDLNSLCDFRRTYKAANMILGSGIAEEYRKIMTG